MTYPACILPKSNWLKSISIDDVLVEQIELQVVRRIDGTIDECVEEMDGIKYLTQDALHTLEDQDLSMNLLGGRFIVDFYPWRQYNGAEHDWDGSDIDVAYMVGRCEHKVPSFPVFFNVYDIHNRDVPYQKGIKNEKEAVSQIDLYGEKMLDLEFSPNQIRGKFKARTKLNHKPTMGNYWHVTIGYEDVDGKMLTSLSGWKKHLVNAAVNYYLAKSIAFEARMPVPLISKSFYVQKSSDFLSC